MQSLYVLGPLVPSASRKPNTRKASQRSPAVMGHRHILLVTFPAQGHINPVLQLAKRLIQIGVEVTFATTISAHRRFVKNYATPAGLNLAPFSDGYDDGFKPGVDPRHLMSEQRRRGSQTIREIVAANLQGRRPITCLIYSLLLPWAAEVARELHVPPVLLWVQPAAVLDIYYYYFNGHGDAIGANSEDPSWSIELPGLPPLTGRDLPSFLLPSDTYAFILEALKEQIEIIGEDSNSKILVNTFDSLEAEAMRAVGNLNLVGIGPLIPSAFLGGKDPSDTCFGADLFQKSRSYVQWLNSKAESSVVYVSFGSILVLPKQQMEEIGRGLLDSGRPFLWVIREREDGAVEREEDKLSCMEELEQKGMVVPWCSQLEVLSHPSLGCFVTHCGWNSTLESLACGVAVVAFPRWTDQGTNAKLIEDVWGTGVRVRADPEGQVAGDELKRCLEMVMGGGQRGEEMRGNAKKWKELAREAARDGGSSTTNLKVFVDEIAEGCM